MTASKLTLEDKENWNEEPPLPPWEPPGVRPMLPSQKHKWKLMFNQDPCSGSIAGDSGHGMMATTSEAEPIDSNEELIRAMGGIDENALAHHLSDVEWKKEDPLIEFNDENVTTSQTPAAASTPIQALTENKTLSPLESPMGKKPCFWESTAACLSKTASPLCLSLTTGMQS